MGQSLSWPWYHLKRTKLCFDTWSSSPSFHVGSIISQPMFYDHVASSSRSFLLLLRRSFEAHSEHQNRGPNLCIQIAHSSHPSHCRLLINQCDKFGRVSVYLFDRSAQGHCARRSTNELGEGTEKRTERKARRRLVSSILVSLDSARSGHGLAGSESGGAADAVPASRISTPGTYRRVFHILLQHDARHLPGGSGGDLSGGSSQLALLQSPTLALAGVNVRRRGERQAAEIEAAASFSQERSVEVSS